MPSWAVSRSAATRLRQAILPLHVAVVRSFRAHFGAPQHKREAEVLSRAQWWATVLVRAGAQGM